MVGRNVPLLFLFLSLICVQFSRCAFFPEAARSVEKYGEPFTSGSRKGNQWIKDLCSVNGGPDAYDNFSVALNETQKCMSDDAMNWHSKIHNVWRTWDLGSVFRDVCNKDRALTVCAKGLLSAMKPCLETSEKMIPDNLEKVNKGVMDFVCSSEGDDVILFLFKGGIRCMTERAEAFKACVDPKLDKYPKKPASGQSGLWLLKFGQQECQDVFAVQDCLVSEFEKCSAPTPVTFAKSLFKSINKEIPCKNATENSVQ